MGRRISLFASDSGYLAGNMSDSQQEQATLPTPVRGFVILKDKSKWTAPSWHISKCSVVDYYSSCSVSESTNHVVKRNNSINISVLHNKHFSQVPPNLIKEYVLVSWGRSKTENGGKTIYCSQRPLRNKDERAMAGPGKGSRGNVLGANWSVLCLCGSWGCLSSALVIIEFYLKNNNNNKVTAQIPFVIIFF